MKAHRNLSLMLLLLAGAASSAFAGPPSDFWLKRPTPKPAAKASNPVPKAELPGGLTCAYMLVPNVGQGFSKASMVTVRCTPEMMKKDWRCQQACAAAIKKD